MSIDACSMQRKPLFHRSLLKINLLVSKVWKKNTIVYQGIITWTNSGYFSNNSLAVLTCPWWQAVYNGVYPVTGCARGSAPCCSSIVAISVRPNWQALDKKKLLLINDFVNLKLCLYLNRSVLVPPGAQLTTAFASGPSCCSSSRAARMSPRDTAQRSACCALSRSSRKNNQNGNII